LDDGDIVRIDVQNPFAHDLRLPDPTLGNIYHRPGSGLTLGNILEGIIDSPLREDADTAIVRIAGWGN